ncbi:PepSY domain-containing protein [uncultured Chloroflexus sp.]|uniref:PepSY domain-containing protein n=1 Tax=uncultured Chloroflexus sp. TaxID=214040 RepID=UPI0026194896|nr:PepSY domain-containing protein [uncultured Chloroflexus sp.]
MNRTMFLISAALTAFVLVVIGGVVSRLSVTTPTDQMPTEIVIESTPIAVPALDPATEAQIREREAAYQAALAEANQRLAEANQRLVIAQQALNSPAPAAPAAPALAAPAAPNSAPAAPPAPTYTVSPQQAQEIALANAGGATLIRAPELVSLQGTPAYEVMFDRGAIYIDAQTGTVLANTIAAPPAAQSNPISPDQAVAAATAYLGGGTVVKVEREYEHGVDVYEVKFSDGSEVYVDAYTGQIAYAKIKNGGGDNDDDDKKKKDDDDKKKDD